MHKQGRIVSDFFPCETPYQEQNSLLVLTENLDTIKSGKEKNPEGEY